MKSSKSSLATLRRAAPGWLFAPAAFAACFFASHASATTLAVHPSGPEHGSIQQMLDKAQHGDTVLVDPGDYQERVVLPSGVTLRARDGAASTRIVGDTRGVVVFSANGDSSTRLEGFTITGGNGTKIPPLRTEAGGGLLAYRSSIQVRDNIFRGNRLEVGRGVGGGVALFESPGVVVENNEFDSNRANGGGGLYARSCTLLVVHNNHFIHNLGTQDGGGVFLDFRTQGQVEGNVFERNTAGWGGGISVGRLTKAEILANTIVANTGKQWGGGMFILDSRPLVERNLVAENYCSHHGGGIGSGRAAFPDLRCNLGWHNVPENFYFAEDSTDVPGFGQQTEADPQMCDFTGANFHPMPRGPADRDPCGRIGALAADCPRVQKILH